MHILMHTHGSRSDTCRYSCTHMCAACMRVRPLTHAFPAHVNTQPALPRAPGHFPDFQVHTSGVCAEVGAEAEAEAEAKAEAEAEASVSVVAGADVGVGGDVGSPQHDDGTDSRTLTHPHADVHPYRTHADSLEQSTNTHACMHALTKHPNALGRPIDGSTGKTNRAPAVQIQRSALV